MMPMASISETTPLAEIAKPPIITDSLEQEKFHSRHVSDIPKHLKISDYKLPVTPDIDLDTAFI